MVKKNKNSSLDKKSYSINQHTQVYSSLVPPSRELEKIEKISPGSTKKIISITEDIVKNEQEVILATKETNLKIISSQHKDNQEIIIMKKRSQLSSFFFAFIFFLASLFLLLFFPETDNTINLFFFEIKYSALFLLFSGLFVLIPLSKDSLNLIYALIKGNKEKK